MTTGFRTNTTRMPIYHLDNMYLILFLRQRYRGGHSVRNFINREHAIYDLNDNCLRNHIEAPFSLFEQIGKYEHHHFDEWSAASYEHIDGFGIIFGFSNERDMMIAKLLS